MKIKMHSFYVTVPLA